MFYITTLQVPISYQGYYFWDNKFVEKLDAWYYKKYGFWKNKGQLFVLSQSLHSYVIITQQLITKDMISLRVSASVNYMIIDGQKFIENFLSEYETTIALYKEDTYIRETAQVFLREYIANIDSTDLLESQSVLQDIDVSKLNTELEKLGLKIEKLALRDIVFPKKIQDLYAKKLEAKIRSEAELENARTVVSTTRALKNASKMLEWDENVKFLQYIEAMTKIAATGKHTFHFWEFEKK